MTDSLERIKAIRRRMAALSTSRTPSQTEAQKEREAELERLQFVESYKPETTFKQKTMSDIGTMLSSLPKIPGALWHTTKEAMVASGMPYDMDKPLKQIFWNPEWNPIKKPEQRQTILNMLKKGAIGTQPLSMGMYAPYTEKIEPLQRWKEKYGVATTPQTEMANRLLLNSMIKNTGKWVYDPEAKGRKWFPSPKEETSRWQEFKEHPGLVGFEDIVNLAIVAAPIVKATGLGGKLAVTRPAKWAKGTQAAKGIESAKTFVGQRTKFQNIVSEMRAKQYQRMEMLRTGKLKQALEAVPKGSQAELEALLTSKASPWKLTPQVSKAYKLAERSATIETKSLINKGLLTKSQAKSAVWKGLTKEFGKSIDDLERLGIKEPVYYPHTFAKYPAKSYLTFRKTKPGFLKERMGVAGYEEPFISIPKHKTEFITQKTISEALGNIEKTFGKKIVKSEGLLPGYVEWKPKGYLEYFKEPGGKLVYVKKAKAYKNLQIPKQIDKACIDAFKAPLPEVLEKTLKAVWDPLTNTWKMSVLALSPRWIFNNIMGNFILNISGGVGAKGYFDAIRAMYKARKMTKAQGISMTRAMRRQHVPSRAWESGLYRAEARVATPTAKGSWLVADKAPITSMWKKLGYQVGKVPKAMYRFNSGVESFFRTAHYLDKIGKPGFNSVKAVASVNEFLFDYSALSALEKATIRRIDPFWAWHKNITRLAVSYPVKHPIGTALYQKAQALVKDDKDYRFIPEYMKGYTELPFEIGGEQAYLSTRGLNPFADIMSGLSALHPALKILIERTTGTELWKGKQFTSPYAGWGSTEKVVPPLWRHIISQFPHAKLIETMFRPYATYSTGEPLLDKEGQIKYQKSRLLEILKMFGINIGTYDLDEMMQQGIEGAMREQTTKEKYAEKLRKFQQQ